MEKINVKVNVFNVQKFVSDDKKVVKYYFDCFEVFKDKKSQELKASRLLLNQKYRPSITDTEDNKFAWLNDLPTFTAVNLVLEFDFRKNETRVVDVFECDSKDVTPLTILV